MNIVFAVCPICTRKQSESTAISIIGHDLCETQHSDLPESASWSKLHDKAQSSRPVTNGRDCRIEEREILVCHESISAPHQRPRRRKIRGYASGPARSLYRRHRRFGRWLRSDPQFLPCHAGRQRHRVCHRSASRSDPCQPGGRAVRQMHGNAGGRSARWPKGGSESRLHLPAGQGDPSTRRLPVPDGPQPATTPAASHRLLLQLAGRGSRRQGHRHRPLGHRHRRHPGIEGHLGPWRRGSGPGPGDGTIRWHAAQRPGNRRRQLRAGGRENAGSPFQLRAPSLCHQPGRNG